MKLSETNILELHYENWCVKIFIWDYPWPSPQRHWFSRHGLRKLSGGTNGKELTCQCRRHKRCRFDLRVVKIPWRRAWKPTPVLMLGESHGQRSLKDYGPCGCKQLDMTEVTWHSTLESFLITFSSSPDDSYTASLGPGLWKTIYNPIKPSWNPNCLSARESGDLMS